MLYQLLHEMSKNGPSVQHQQPFQVKVVVTVMLRETQLPPLPTSLEEDELGPQQQF